MASKGSEKMKLYWYPAARSMRIIWLIKELKAGDDIKLIKYKPNSNPPKDAIYRKTVHPNGTIPALEIPGREPLLESGAICMYLADKYGDLAPDPKDRADYYDFIMYGNATLDIQVDFYYMMWGLNTEYSEEKQKEMNNAWDTSMNYLAKRLEGKQYLCGDKLTTADCVVGYDLYLASLLKDGEALKRYPKILEYLGRLQAREAYQEAATMTQGDEEY